MPTVVTDELREVASYDDAHGRGATVVLSRTDVLDTQLAWMPSSHLTMVKTLRALSQTATMPPSYSVTGGCGDGRRGPSLLGTLNDA